MTPDVFLISLPREPYLTRRRAAATRLASAGFSRILDVAAVDLAVATNYTQLEVLMHTWRLRVLPAVRQLARSDAVLVAEDDVVPCDSAANITAAVRWQLEAHPAVDVVAVGYQSHPVSGAPAWGTQLMAVRTEAAERLAAALTHSANDPVLQHNKPHCCNLDRWLYGLNRAVRAAGRDGLSRHFGACAAAARSRRGRHGGGSGGGRPLECPVRWTEPLAGFVSHGNSLTDGLTQLTRAAVTRHVRRQMAAARRRAGGANVDAGDVLRHGGGGGGGNGVAAAADARDHARDRSPGDTSDAPRAQLPPRAGRSCVAGRAAPTGWSGVVSAPDEMSADGLVVPQRTPAVAGWAPLPASCEGRVAFDIGTNAGQDTAAFLRHGLCVVGIDANPQMAAAAKSAAAAAAATIAATSTPAVEALVLNAGVSEVGEVGGEGGGGLTFYVAPQSIWSSFDLRKATRHARRAELRPVRVPTVRCDALWQLLPTPASRPSYVKVDIEEKHYECVEALARLPRRRRPSFISWEMHEIARGLRFPALDAQLIALLHRLGYDTIKVESNRFGADAATGAARGAFSGGRMPDAVTDMVTNSTDWLPTKRVLARGLDPYGRVGRKWRHGGDWYDFHMRLAPESGAAGDVWASRQLTRRAARAGGCTAVREWPAGPVAPRVVCQQLCVC